MSLVTPSQIQDAEALTALLTDAPSGGDLRFADRQRRWLTPSSNTYTQNICFDMGSIDKIWSLWENSILRLPLDITFSAALTPSPVFPPVAFKDSVLSALYRFVVKSANGGSFNLDQGNNSLTWANHLRLALAEDEDWLQAVGPELHFSRDRGHKGVPSLKNLDEIQYPNVSPYIGTPVIGGAGQDGTFLNTAYNQGFSERRGYLMKAVTSDLGVVPALNGTTLSFIARIPLRAISDAFRALGESGPLFSERLQFEFYLASTVNTAYCPIAIGSVIGAGAGANTQSSGGTVNISVTPGIEPRLYYEEVTMRPEQAALASQRLANGYQKRLLYRTYEVAKDVQVQQNVANGAVITHRVASSAVAAQRLWVLCYPTGVLNTTGWPGILCTGPNSLMNMNVMINGKSVFNQPINTVDEQYEMFKDAAHIGADSQERESMISFTDFRLTNRLVPIDLSRTFSLMADPNAPCDLQVTGTVASVGNVDIVYVLEKLEEAVFDFSNGLVRTSVGPALVR